MAAKISTEWAKGNDGGASVSVKGLDDLKAAMRDLSQSLRKKVLLGALRKAARVVSADAKQSAPTLQTPVPYRTKGLVKKRISVRTSKAARAAGNVGVFVNVRPLKSAAITAFKAKGGNSARNPEDPFYWKFLEFGTKKMPAKSFLRKAVDKLPEALEVFEREIIPQIEKLNTRK